MRKNDIDPYVIGALIGDGTITNLKNYDAYLTSADIDIVEQFVNDGVCRYLTKMIECNILYQG